MKNIDLGKTGMKVSVIGLGTWAIGGGPAWGGDMDTQVSIDTIGAGDNFAAGFITALLDGKELINCAQFANATASIAVQNPGATTGVMNKKQVEEVFKYYG